MVMSSTTTTTVIVTRKTGGIRTSSRGDDCDDGADGDYGGGVEDNI